MNPLVDSRRLAHTTQLYCVYDIGDNSAIFKDISETYLIPFNEVCWISFHAAVVRMNGGHQTQVEQDIARWAIIRDYQTIYPDGRVNGGYAAFVMNVEFTSDILLGALLRIINPANYEWIVADNVVINNGALYLGLAVIEGV